MSIELLPDKAAWLPVAEAVLRGAFDKADKSTVQSLAIGLRSVPHPLAVDALARLPDNKEKPSND